MRNLIVASILGTQFNAWSFSQGAETRTYDSLKLQCIRIVAKLGVTAWVPPDDTLFERLATHNKATLIFARNTVTKMITWTQRISTRRREISNEQGIGATVAFTT
ncbi:MAG: hypothetical protein AAF936_09360 [Pseudomonadota bacterium]